MRIVLAADLHFGSVPEGLQEKLADCLNNSKPDVIVIAGDMTLRARRNEFEAAKLWLTHLEPPVLLLPGNHDLPYWNLYQRFADPFGRFRHAFGASDIPIFQHDHAYVLGFNTTRSWQPHLSWQEGVARRADIATARAALLNVTGNVMKIVAAHHPFVAVEDVPRARPVYRAQAALEAFLEGGVELLLSGHTHQSFAVQFDRKDRRFFAIGAPTALSSRMRGEANGFWLIETENTALEAALYLRSSNEFVKTAERQFLRAPRQA